MKRRTFLACLGAAAIANEAVAQRKVHRVVVVHPSAAITDMNESGSTYYRTLFAELRRHGYVDGENLAVERRSGEGRTGSYPELAREVVSLKPDLIYSNSRRLVQHIQTATSTIPVVAMTSDPVVAGLAKSLANPGGNITGVSTDVGYENLDKRLEILKEVAPGVTRTAFLAPLAGWEGPSGAQVRGVGPRLAIEIVAASLQDPINADEYGRAFERMRADGVNGLMVGQQQENVTNAHLIVELAGNYRLPAIYPYREFSEIGGLVAYSVDQVELWRAAAGYIARILSGANPGELPIHRPSRFQLIINMQAAKSLGLTIPPTLLARADEVIE
jgi:putative ABC transport system substrate-binding protein